MGSNVKIQEKSFDVDNLYEKNSLEVLSFSLY